MRVGYYYIERGKRTENVPKTTESVLKTTESVLKTTENVPKIAVLTT